MLDSDEHTEASQAAAERGQSQTHYQIWRVAARRLYSLT